MAALTQVFELPYPPSVNHYWRRVGSRTLISRGGRRYRRDVMALLAAGRTAPLRGRLEVIVHVFPPDGRRRDLDNLQKALCDALQHAGVYADDSQIDRLDVRRAPIVPGGKVIVQVTERTRTGATHTPPESAPGHHEVVLGPGLSGARAR